MSLLAPPASWSRASAALRANPLIKIINDSQRAATFYAGLLGLTPSGRASLASPTPQTDGFDEFEKFFK